MTKLDSQLPWLTTELQELEANHLYRRFRVFENVKSTQATVEGKRVTIFSGNNYLGLAQHPRLIEAAQKALGTHGVGASSARLISGTTDLHASLEARIAQFEGKERALLFSTGYLANLGTLSALVGSGDEIILDKLDHASLIDAARLSGATVRVYPHGNLDYLEKLLERTKARRTWIVTDSVFSMDGDLAPLRDLVQLKNRYGAYLVVDEAHGTGVFGKMGRGVSELMNVSDSVDVHIGTLSKAVGALGGFVVGRSKLIEYLMNRARSFIFSTALPPSICAAAIQAFDLIEEEPEIRKRLWQNVELLQSGLKQAGVPISASQSPIIPVVYGEEERALKVSHELLGKGFFVPAVRYPTVPKGKARLRLTVSAAHSEEEIKGLVSALGQVNTFH